MEIRQPRTEATAGSAILGWLTPGFGDTHTSGGMDDLGGRQRRRGCALT